MSAAEAMAFGLPGVSFDLESLKTYYPQGMIKTPCFDLNQFAENICLLLDNPKLYQSLSRKASRLIVTHWNWSKKSSDVLKTIVQLKTI
jgi:glycosyltransferase involved in cell wall biosynthesis